MKKLSIILAVLACAALYLHSQEGGSKQEAYLARFSALAVEEMYRTGVPASITMAQGMLESGFGTSRLAVQGNNHFGIKCHRSWQGRTMRADDDRPGECFRVYDTPEESFRDHSDFLRYQDRYKFLFDLELTDYKSWALGLKKAGYATSPDYAEKLISIIERYHLYDLDFYGDKAVAGGEPHTIPDSPNTIEATRPFQGTPSEQYRFPLSRELYSRNGVPFVMSCEGESYRSIAKQSHLFLFEILRYNDLKADQALYPGTIVYLQPKKKYAASGLDMYIVGQDGESLHDICQRFAVRESSIRSLNGFKSGHQLREGEKVYLRKK